MASTGAKDITKSIRLTLEQWRRAVRAARSESKRIGAKVHPTVLLAEVGTRGVDQILASPDGLILPPSLLPNV